MNMLDRTLGRLACEIPGITAVFSEHGLDVCRNGRQTLRAAAAGRGLDIDALQTKLEALQPAESSGENWAEAPDTRLIEHIMTRYHDGHREQLSELVRLARRVEQVHGDRADCPAGLADHLEQVQVELENHMQKEEQILFPMIAQGGHATAVHPVAMMRHEHEEHLETLTRIERLTHDITPPEDACNTWRALYAGLAGFKADLMDHIHLENNVLFERVDGQARR